MNINEALKVVSVVCDSNSVGVDFNVMYSGLVGIVDYLWQVVPESWFSAA